MWELDNRKGWMLKNWCLWTVVLEKTLESHLDYKETKAVNPKGNQTWIFMGRTDAEAEAWILWPPDVKSWLIGKDPDSGKDWKQKEKRPIERMKWFSGIIEMSLSKLWEIVKDRKPGVLQFMGFAKSRTWLSDGTTGHILVPLDYHEFKGWLESVIGCFCPAIGRCRPRAGGELN